MSERSLQKWFDQELEVMVHVHEVRNEYEKQSQLYVTLIFLSLYGLLGFMHFSPEAFFFFVIEGALHLVRSLPF
jgi:hypothetical protein